MESGDKRQSSNQEANALMQRTMQWVLKLFMKNLLDEYNTPNFVGVKNLMYIGHKAWHQTMAASMTLDGYSC